MRKYEAQRIANEIIGDLLLAVEATDELTEHMSLRFANREHKVTEHNLDKVRGYFRAERRSHQARGLSEEEIVESKRRWQFCSVHDVYWHIENDHCPACHLDVLLPPEQRPDRSDEK